MQTKRALFFIGIFALLWLLFGAILWDTERIKETNFTQPISALTTLPPPALSAYFLEPRIRFYRDYRTYLYPTMQPIDYLGFVYAK